MKRKRQPLPRRCQPGRKDLTSSPTLTSNALLVQTWLRLEPCSTAANQECDASCNAAHRCVPWPFHAVVFGQDIRVGLKSKRILATTISVFDEMLSENLDDIPKAFSTW